MQLLLPSFGRFQKEKQNKGGEIPWFFFPLALLVETKSQSKHLLFGEDPLEDGKACRQKGIRYTLPSPYNWLPVLVSSLDSSQQNTPRRKLGGCVWTQEKNSGETESHLLSLRHFNEGTTSFDHSSKIHNCTVNTFPLPPVGTRMYSESVMNLFAKYSFFSPQG